MHLKKASRLLYLALLVITVPVTTLAAQSPLTYPVSGDDQDPEDQSNTNSSVRATQPGIGIGFSVGYAGQMGSTSSSIQNSLGYEGYLRYGSPFGLFLRGGIHISTHEIEQASPSYRLTSFFLEPQYVALSLSSHWAPFVSGRIAYLQEGVDQPGSDIKASGFSLGGGLGTLYRLTPQVALEGALSFALASLGDYIFRGEFHWYECLQSLEPGTALPETVVRCDGSSTPPQYNCYPPFFPEFAGHCTPPEIPYSGSGRSTTWFQMRFGVQLSLNAR